MTLWVSLEGDAKTFLRFPPREWSFLLLCPFLGLLCTLYISLFPFYTITAESEFVNKLSFVIDFEAFKRRERRKTAWRCKKFQVFKNTDTPIKNELYDIACIFSTEHDGSINVRTFPCEFSQASRGVCDLSIDCSLYTHNLVKTWRQ